MTAQEVPSQYQNFISPGKDWRQIVALVDDLPPMPHVATKLLAMVERPEMTTPEIERVMTGDPALAASVLKIANSALFARQRQINTISQSVTLIGFKTLKGVITAAALKKIQRNTSEANKMVWYHSVGTAIASVIVATKLKKTYRDEIFLLGLLSNLGQLAFLDQIAKEYDKVLDLVETEHLEYAAAEFKLFGYTHPLLGALVAKKWNFSEDSCQVILHCKDDLTGPKPQTGVEEKTAIVQFANLLATKAGIGIFAGYPDISTKIRRVAQYLGILPESIDEVVDELTASCKERFAAERHIYE